MNELKQAKNELDEIKDEILRRFYTALECPPEEWTPSTSNLTGWSGWTRGPFFFRNYGSNVNIELNGVSIGWVDEYEYPGFFDKVRAVEEYHAALKALSEQREYNASIRALLDSVEEIVPAPMEKLRLEGTKTVQPPSIKNWWSRMLSGIGINLK